MIRMAGRWLVAISLLHLGLGLWLGRGAFAAIARAGFFDALAISSARQLWFWYVLFAPPFTALGILLARGEAAPRSPWLGGWIAGVAAVGACLMPKSGFWLLFAPAALLLAGTRRTNPSTEWRRGEFSITSDASRFDRAAIHDFLAGSYWAAEIPRGVVDRSIEGSLCFGLLDGERQIGFARVVTDRSTFAYLADVYVLEEYRGRGLALWMMEVVRGHPDLQNLRRWMLVTRDAHPLYRKMGFTPLSHPERLMEIAQPDMYRKARGGLPTGPIDGVPPAR